MATVASILSIASKVSGLRAETAEEDIALAAINQGYLRACLDTELTGKDVTYTVTSTTGTLAASSIAGEAIYRVQHFRLESSSQRIPLKQASRQEVQDYRAADEGQSTPIMYSVSMVNATPTVDVYPDFTVGDRIKMSFLAAPTTLVATSTSIPYLPEMFHHDILTATAIGALLERDGKFDEAGRWQGRALEAIVRLEEYLGQMGGVANRSYFGPESSAGSHPDRRIR